MGALFLHVLLITGVFNSANKLLGTKMYLLVNFPAIFPSPLFFSSIAVTALYDA